MFDHTDAVVGLWPGETPETLAFEDQLAFEVACREIADGWTVEDRQVLPDLGSIAPNVFLAAVLGSVDRSRLNGFDLVEVLKAGERLVSHFQAGVAATTHEMAHAVPGGVDSDPARRAEGFEFAADELRPALCITRRAAESRMSMAFDLCERLPRVWEMLDTGLIDLSRARVICDGTAHLPAFEAAEIVEIIAEKASQLTTGQLAAWIRRLCVETDPRQAEQRAEHAREQRSLTIEPTVDGTAHVHLWDIDITEAQAIGRRINGHMISLQKDGDTRSHDQIRADVATDFLLGSDPTHRGRGLFDMRVSLTTLAGLDDHAAEIPGMGPVVAEAARRYADRHHRAHWQATITDDDGNVLDVVTLSRRPSKRVSSLVAAEQPTCSFPGCRMPARDCDFDHLTPWIEHGHTSIRNGGPKCRHDHILKDHGWRHQRINGRDQWTSPLGHTYVTEKPP